MALNKDLVSTFVADVAGPFLTSHAAEKEIQSTAVPKIVEAKITQDRNRFKGMCINYIV